MSFYVHVRTFDLDTWVPMYINFKSYTHTGFATVAATSFEVVWLIGGACANFLCKTPYQKKLTMRIWKIKCMENQTPNSTLVTNNENSEFHEGKCRLIYALMAAVSPQAYLCLLYLKLSHTRRAITSCQIKLGNSWRLATRVYVSLTAKQVDLKIHLKQHRSKSNMYVNCKT